MILKYSKKKNILEFGLYFYIFILIEHEQSRYYDGNELKYSLRSVDKFFDWYRKIFIVTNGQIPNWLNVSHPKIKVVTHQEIFKNTSFLPTFSSPAIEANIHRIEGLSEEFIYLNDDIMFANKIEKADFFTSDGRYKIFVCWFSDIGSFNLTEDAFGNSIKYVNNIFDQNFGHRFRKVICHTPHYMKKSVIEDLQNTFPEEFEKTSSHKFRSNDDMQFSFS
jgi:hypothetical protein